MLIKGDRVQRAVFLLTVIEFNLKNVLAQKEILEILKISIQGNLFRMKTGRKDLDKIIINLKVIGQFNVLNGFIPINLCELQHRF